MLIPYRHAALVFGIIQSALTTGVATAIATWQSVGLGLDMVPRWLGSWGIAWLTMLPIVIVFAPVIRRAVASITAPQ